MPESRAHSSLPGINLSLFALIVSLGGSANFAYHLVLTNPAQDGFVAFVNKSLSAKYDFEDLTKDQLETWWSVIVSSLYWGTVVGAILIQPTAKKLGRKHALTCANCVQALAVAISILAYRWNDVFVYAASRILLGIAQAISLGIAPMYIAECSPVRCRGVISLSTCLIMQSFVVIAAIVALPNIWGNEHAWYKLYVAEFVELVFVIIFSLRFPESPDVLHSHGHKAAAEASIEFYHGIGSLEAAALLDATKVEQKEDDLGLFAVLRNADARRGTILGCLVMLALIYGGIAVVNAFAVGILRNTGLNETNAAYANIGICLISVLAVLVAGFIVDKSGRRPLVLWGTLGCAVSNVLIFAFMFCFQKIGDIIFGWGLVVTICIFIFICCISVAPLAFFITSELVEPRARPAAATWSNLVLSVSRSIILATFLPVKNVLGEPITYLVMFLPPLIFALFYMYSRLPETKGRTYAEVQKEFEKMQR